MMTDSIPFDPTATRDLGQTDAAMAATGVDAYRVLGSTSHASFEFDTSSAGWCLSCPGLNFFFGPHLRLREDDPDDHYIAVNADWYVAVQINQGFLGFMSPPPARDTLKNIARESPVDCGRRRSI